jgi:hypothetical protein
MEGDIPFFYNALHGHTPFENQNLFFVPVPIFPLDIKKVLEAFRVHRILGTMRSPRSRAEENNDSVFDFSRHLAFTQLTFDIPDCNP